MANGLTLITATKDIATCVAVALAGPCKIRAAGMVEGDVVYIYEENPDALNADGTYSPVPDSAQRKVVLEFSMPSIVFEGYGKYKFLLGADTNANLVVGYAS